jgi:radical SAM-linked protein
MLGLPHEEQADMEGIVNLGYEALRAAKNRGQITISLSTFVPKPHTPFQWERQISMDETHAQQDFIRQRIKNRNINVKWHDAKMSFLEGIFSRGDERIGKLLETAFRKGCRFDGWSEILRFDLWQEAIAETGINPQDFMRERDTCEKLPWDNIDCGVSREFLLEEKQKSTDQTVTADCRFDDCQNCGVCDFSATKNIFAAKDEYQNIEASQPLTNCAAGTEKKYRLTFSKLGRAGFLSHLEISAALVRALRRSSIEIAYSMGYHPHPKISFATATSVGMESKQEFLDIAAQEYLSDFDLLKGEINSALPLGIEILEIKMLSSGDKTIAEILQGFEFELHLPADIDSSRLIAIEDNIRNFLAASTFSIQKSSKGKTVTKDIRPFIMNMILDAANKKITFTVKYTPTGSARPADIIAHVLKSDADESLQIRVMKTKTLLGCFID